MIIWLCSCICVLNLQLNPEHTVPTLVNVDENFAIWDSHAICCYLIDKFANDDKLYPKDLQLRAKCNQRMFFDAASLFICLRDINAQVVWKGATEIPQDKLDAIQKAYNILELFLVSDPFLVGQNLTIADISAATSVLALETYAQVNANKHPNIIAWLHRVRETIPFFDEINGETTKSLREILLGILEKNRSQSSK